MSFAPSLAGLAPFQLGFVVRDLERAAREFDQTLDAGPYPLGFFVEAVQPPQRMPPVDFSF